MDNINKKFKIRNSIFELHNVRAVDHDNGTWLTANYCKEYQSDTTSNKLYGELHSLTDKRIDIYISGAANLNKISVIIFGLTTLIQQDVLIHQIRNYKLLRQTLYYLYWNILTIS